MEREINRVILKLKPEAFATLCRCVADDFEAYYQNCGEDPYADHTDDLDRMEADLDLLQDLLPSIASKSTDDMIELIVADFKRKIAEVA